MTQIVAGVFDDEQSATAVAHELRDAGFDAGSLDQFSLNPPGRHHGLPLGGDQDADPKAEGGEGGAVTGAAIGTAVGAVAGLAATPLVGPIAIAGGAIIHPIIFVLALVALWMFFSGWRGRTI